MAQMTLNMIQLGFNGKFYKYDVNLMTWYVGGYAVYPKDVPNQVKNARDALIDTISEGDFK